MPGAPPHVRAPVSVEAIQGYLDFAKKTFGRFRNTREAFLKLTESIHPHVLGQAFRTRLQIRMLGEKLLSTHPATPDAVDRILRFLCSESGSHDYTITRQEARKMGLPIETPTDTLYAQIRNVYHDFANELELQSIYDPNVVAAHIQGMNSAPYTFRRALIESVAGGSHVFMSDGTLSRQQIQTQPGVIQNAITDNRTFEGWRHFP